MKISLFSILAGAATKFNDHYRKGHSHQTTVLCQNGAVGKKTSSLTKTGKLADMISITCHSSDARCNTLNSSSSKLFKKKNTTPHPQGSFFMV